MGDDRVWVKDGDHAVGHVQRVFVQVWRGERTLERVGADGQAMLKHLTAAYPQGFCGMIIVEESAQVPTDAARQEMAAALEPYLPCMVGTALIIPGVGIRQALVRSVASVVNLMMRNRAPLKTFDDVRSGLVWLGSLPGERFDQGAAQRFVAHMRAPLIH